MYVPWKTLESRGGIVYVMYLLMQIRAVAFLFSVWVSSLSCVLKNYIPCAKHKERLFDTRDELLVIKKCHKNVI